MNSRILVAFLVAGSMSGCVIYGGGGGGNPGDVTFEWTFDGGLCSSVPDVKWVRITIPGEILQDGGEFPCEVRGYPGIVLHNFEGKSYSFTIDGVDVDGNVLFVDSGTFTVNGDTTVFADLQPVPGENSYAYIGWKFPPNSVSTNPTCAQAGVSSVQVWIDGVPVEYPCMDGFNPNSVFSGWLSSGPHQIELIGLGADRYPYFRRIGTLTTTVGNSFFVEYTLSWAVGSVSVNPRLRIGTTPVSCSTAGVSTLYFDFQDSQGNWLYDPDGDAQACSSSSVLYYLPAGTYVMSVWGWDSSGWQYVSAPQTVIVVNGEITDVFVDVDD
jgi:hypothetical protein